jgi:hypothetical protein
VEHTAGVAKGPELRGWKLVKLNKQVIFGDLVAWATAIEVLSVLVEALEA